MLTVIAGPMFAGKTSTLIDRPGSIVFKPTIDTRDGLDVIRTHDGRERLAVPVAYAADLDRMVPMTVHTVCLDEAQFFGPEVLPAIERMQREGLQVIAVGLDLDSEGRPFGIMPALLSMATEVIKARAVCAVCQDPATRTYRKTAVGEQVLIGGSETYEPRCLECWSEGQAMRGSAGLKGS